MGRELTGPMNLRRLPQYDTLGNRETPDLLDETLRGRFPRLSLPSAAGRLWGEDGTETGVDVALAPAVTGSDREARRVCGSFTCPVWELHLRDQKQAQFQRQSGY